MLKVEYTPKRNERNDLRWEMKAITLCIKQISIPRLRHRFGSNYSVSGRLLGRNLKEPPGSFSLSMEPTIREDSDKQDRNFNCSTTENRKSFRDLKV